MYKWSDCQVGDAPPRYCRSLSDKILAAFHQPCDQNDVEVAKALLTVLGGTARFAVERAGQTGNASDKASLLPTSGCGSSRIPTPIEQGAGAPIRLVFASIRGCCRRGPA